MCLIMLLQSTMHMFKSLGLAIGQCSAQANQANNASLFGTQLIEIRVSWLKENFVDFNLELVTNDIFSSEAVAKEERSV